MSLNQRAVPRKFVNGFLSGSIAVAFCGYILLEGSICSKRGEDMPFFKAPLGSVPSQNVDEGAKSVARDVLAKSDFNTASSAIFTLLKGNGISQQARYDIIRMYADKHHLPALQKIREEALDMGFRYEDPIKFPKEKPALHAYMKTIAYGIAVFGERGFATAIDLVQEGKKLRDPSKEGYPIIYRLATAAAYMVLNNKLIKNEKALEMVNKPIQDPNIAIEEREIFKGWAADIQRK